MFAGGTGDGRFGIAVGCRAGSLRRFVGAAVFGDLLIGVIACSHNGFSFMKKFRCITSG